MNSDASVRRLKGPERPVRSEPERAYVLAALAMVEVPYALGAVYLGVSFLERNLPALLSLGLAGIALSVWALSRLHRRMAAGRDEETVTDRVTV